MSASNTNTGTDSISDWSGNMYSDKIKVGLETQGILNTNESVPFWFRANQFGSVPIKGSSLSAIGNVYKGYTSSRKNKLLDWGAAVEARINAGRESEILLIEAYAKARIGIFEVRAGRSKKVMGLVDSTLSVGSFSVSGNALGIPQVEIAIPQYWSLPIWENLISFKGNFSFGWVGYTPINLDAGDFKRSDVPGVKSYVHQKSLYGRLGKPTWRLNLIAGLNHQTMYGNEAIIFTNFDLNKFQSFYYAVTGKTWYDNNRANTKLGNQLGSIDVGASYEFNSVSLLAYRQQIYDVGALAHGANLRDGLTGVNVTNTEKEQSFFYWKKILLELFYTKNQAGESWSPITPSGDEAYYNNFMYTNGWSYKGMGLGNPFITPRNEGRRNLRFKDDEYFVNNRVIAFHTALQGGIGKLRIITKLSYSKNYGTYGTSPLGTSRNKLRWPLPPPYFEKVNQFSGFIECNLPLRRNWQVGISTAYDSGELLYNSFGIMASLKKTLWL